MKRHSKRLLSLLLSVAMFFGVISYSTVALAAELNTVRLNMRISGVNLRDVDSTVAQPGGALLDVDNKDDGSGEKAETKIAEPNPLPGDGSKITLPEEQASEGNVHTENLTPTTAAPEPQKKITPNADGNGYTYDDGHGNKTIVTNTTEPEGTEITNIVTDDEVLLDKEPGDGAEYAPDDASVATDADAFGGDVDEATEEEAEGMQEVLEELGITPEEGTDYLIQTEDVQISADKSAAVLTQELSVKQYQVDENGEFVLDESGEKIELEETLPVGTIEVTLEAQALGSTAVFSEVDGEVVVNTPRKNIVLAIDITKSMEDDIAATDENGNPISKEKWAVLCEAVQSLVHTVYGMTYNDEDKTWSEPTNKNVDLSLVVYGGSYDPVPLLPWYWDAAAVNQKEINTVEEINELLSKFTGDYEADMLKNFSYNQTGQSGSFIHNGMWDGNGTNNQAGYETALDVVEEIKRKNGDSYDPENITVVYLTDGEANQYYGNKPITGTRVPRDADTTTAGHKAADEAVEILEEGAKLINIVINDNSVNMDKIEDYMDPADEWQSDKDEATKIVKTPVEKNDAVIRTEVDQKTATLWGQLRDGYEKIGSRYYKVDLKEGYVEEWEGGLLFGSYKYYRKDRVLRDGYRQDGENYYELGYLNKLVQDLPEEQRGNVTYTAAADAKALQSVFDGLAEEIVKDTMASAAVAYDARMIDVVPACYDVVVGSDSNVTVIGKDKEGNTVIEWNIGDMNSLNGGNYKTSYYLLPNSTLGKDYVYGTVLTNDSAVLYCKPIAALGKEIAIVLDRPIVTIAAEANPDDDGIVHTFGAFDFNIKGNDSGHLPEDKLTASGTGVTDTEILFDANAPGSIAQTVPETFEEEPAGKKLRYTDADGNIYLLDIEDDGTVMYGGTQYTTGSGARGALTLLNGYGLNVLGSSDKLERGNIKPGTNNNIDLSAPTETDEDYEFAVGSYGTLTINKKTGLAAFKPTGSMVKGESITVNIPYSLVFWADIIGRFSPDKDNAVLKKDADTNLKASGGDSILYDGDDPSTEEMRKKILEELLKKKKLDEENFIKEFGEEYITKSFFTFTISEPAAEYPELVLPIVTPTPPPPTDDPTPTAPPTTAPVAPTPTPTATPEATTTPTTVPDEEIPLAPPADDTGTPAVQDNETPLAAPETPTWALVNLLLTIASAVTFAVMMARYVGKSYKKGDKLFDVKKHGGMRLLTGVPAIGSIVAFILTEDMSLPMSLTDQWTLLMAAIAIIQAGAVLLSAKHDREIDAIAADIDG